MNWLQLAGEAKRSQKYMAELNLKEVFKQLTPETAEHLAICYEARQKFGKPGYEIAEDLLEQDPIDLQNFDKQKFLQQIEARLKA